MEEQAKKNFIINVIFFGLWILLIVIMGKFLLNYLLPFVVAVVIAAFVQKPAEFVSSKIKIKKGTCAALISAAVYLGLAALVVLAAVFLLEQMGEWLIILSKSEGKINSVLIKADRMITDFSENFTVVSSQKVKEIFSDILMDFAGKLSDFLSRTAAKIVKKSPAVLFSGLVTLAATCYIAKDFDRLCVFLKNLTNKKTFKTAKKVKDIFKDCVLKMLGGYAILMLVTFAEILIGLLILGVKNAGLTAVLISVVDILPVFGAGTVLLPWSFLSVVSGNTGFGIGIAVLYITVTVIRNFLEPKIVGSKMGTNPLFVLITMFLGLRLLGFLGMIILPVTFIVVFKYYKSEMEQDTSHI